MGVSTGLKRLQKDCDLGLPLRDMIVTAANPSVNPHAQCLDHWQALISYPSAANTP